jgi:hypothetical protein
MSWTFPVRQISDNQYEITGSVWVFGLFSASGSATVTKKGDSYEIGGSGRGKALGKTGSATFGGSRTSARTDAPIATTFIDKQGNKTTTDASGNQKIVKAPKPAVDTLAAKPESEMPPVGDNTKGVLIGLIALIIAFQIVMEVMSGGSLSIEDIKDTFAAGSEAVEEISASASEGGGE